MFRGLYSRLARGTWVAQTGLHLPQRRQSLIASPEIEGCAMSETAALIERLVPEQIEARRVGVGEIAAGQELAQIETAVRVDSAFVRAELHDLGLVEELELGNPDAMLAGYDPVQPARDAHDARDRSCGRLQHRVIVGIDRNVGVHIAIAGMHVQRHENTPSKNAPMSILACRQNRSEHASTEDL